MGRLLGPSLYGELAALLTLVALIGVIPTFFGLVIVKFISSARDRQETIDLVGWLNNKIVIAAIFLFIAVILTSPFVGNFLNIENPFLIILTGFTIIFFLPSFFYKSVLQGLLKFKELTLSQVTETLGKLLLGVLLVFLGLEVLGAILGLVIASIGGFVLTYFFLKDLIHSSVKRIPIISPVIGYSLPVFIQSLSTISLFSSDLILVKHFFPPLEAGIYAAISTLGKIIFYSCGPIASVMFPIVSQKQSKGESYKKIFAFSFIATTGLSSVILLLYYLIPELMIKLLFGILYLEGKYYLFWFGLFMTFFTLSYLLNNFYLSLGRTKVVYLSLFAAISQVVGIVLFHDSLSTVINVSLIITAGLLICLILYLFFETKLK